VVSLVDLAPTFCELAGTNIPIVMDGESLLSAMKNPESPKLADERFFEYDQDRGRKFTATGVVTSQYKYIDYKDTTDILYNLKRDPQEMNNLIQRWEYEAVVKVFQKRLENWKK
jgi:arylsulfatase A-like enzyme